MARLSPGGHYRISETLSKQQKAGAKKSVDLYKLMTNILKILVWQSKSMKYDVEGFKFVINNFLSAQQSISIFVNQ